jgi:hypothetical protein
MLLVLFAALAGGYGTWGILRSWRGLVDTQLRLNRCTGELALEFRDHLNQIEHFNGVIRSLRASIRAATLALQPEVIPAFEVALVSAVTAQEGELLRWELTVLASGLRGDCRKAGDLADRFPALQYQRDVPDEIGMKPLEWRGEMPSEFHFQIVNGPRGAAAKIEVRFDSLGHNSSWAAHWSRVRKSSGFLRASFL